MWGLTTASRVLDQALDVVTEAFNLAPALPSYGGFSSFGNQVAPSDGRYDQIARKGYAGNEIVYAAIELLVSSAAEPPIVGQRWRRNHPQVQTAIRNAGLQAPAVQNALGTVGVARREREVSAQVGERHRADLSARGIPGRYHGASLVRNGFIELVTDHPLIRLLNNPNPYSSKALFWSTLFMDRQLAGNAYLLKVRGPLGNVVELWRLRPDRVRIVPSREKFVGGYQYTVNRETVTYAAEDVVHIRNRNPLDDYYGQPPLLAFMDRIDIDIYMRRFLKTFYERGGTGPGAILSVKQKLTDTAKDDIRTRLRRLIGGSASFTETLILDNAESTYTQMGLARGLTDALPKEINAVSEARLAMAFGIPGSILGLLIGYESSSYANKRADWQVLWDVTLTPFLSEIDDALNLSLVPEFAGVDEVSFDLSQIKALQDDVDDLHKRARDNFAAGLWSQQEARLVTGVEAEASDDELFFVPSGSTATEYSDLGVMAEPAADPTPEPAQIASAMSVAMVAIAAPRVGRRPLVDDDGARAVWDEAETLRLKNPRMTQEQIAARVGVTARTLRRYRETFGE